MIQVYGAVVSGSSLGSGCVLFEVDVWIPQCPIFMVLVEIL